MVQLRQDNTQRQTQTQRIAPQVIQANALLQCSSLELIQMITQEQQENPALEDASDLLEHDSFCTHCTSAFKPCGRCPLRSVSQISESSPHSTETQTTEDDMAVLAARGNDRREDEQQSARDDAQSFQIEGFGEGGRDGEFDPLMLARAETTLSEHLLSSLGVAAKTPQEMRIAEYLVGCLDERGYLRVDMDEAANALQVTQNQLIQGIAALQDCDPAGVGARDVRECLQLQLRHLRLNESEKDYDPLAEALVTQEWDAFVERRRERAAKNLGVSVARIDHAMAYIQQRLTPDPAGQFRVPWDYRADARGQTVRPDVIVRRTNSGFAVEVPGEEHISLRVNARYKVLYDNIRGREKRRETSLSRRGAQSAEYEKHVVAYVERAELFVRNLQQRRRTIQRITQALIECQQGFVETGQRAYLRPLTRTRLGEILGLHESTISRALLHKFVQMPSQEVLPFDVFFVQAAGTKEAIATMIDAENPLAPLSDEDIREALREQGVEVARRTVVKYREEMRIPASYLRRRR